MKITNRVMPSFFFQWTSRLLLLGIFVISCDDPAELPKQAPVPDNVIQKLKAAGFATDKGLYPYKDGYLVEYDIFLTREQIDELAEHADDHGRSEHYRTPNLVGGVRTLRVFMDPQFINEMQQAFDQVLQRYNTVDLRLRFERTLVSSQANIRVMGESIPTQWDGTEILGRSAGFPSGGEPASNIVLNTRFYNTAPIRGDAVTTIAHEIGHAIGFRHTDYMNRSFSCLSGGNEGGDAVHVPGTPTTPSAGSWMLACSSGGDRPFTAEDVTALRTVYSSNLSIYDLASSYDQIVSLDFDNDNDDDVICYRPGGRIAYLFEFRNGGYVARFGSSTGFFTYDLNSFNDRIIAFDYNGDGRDDVLLYRPGSRIVYVMRSEGNGTFTTVYSSSSGFFGYDLSSSADKIIATDYNNDGFQDIVCYRPGSRIFRLYRSNGNATFTQMVNSSSGIGGFDLNESRDLIISLDYNGDGRDDLACYRPGSRVFYLLRSSGTGSYTRTIGSGSGVATFDLNESVDRLVPLNVDGDAFEDIAAYRPGFRVFHLLRSNGSNFSAVLTSSSGVMTFDFNESVDKAISLDYNADGRSDLLCYRPGRGTIYYGRSTGSNFTREY